MRRIEKENRTHIRHRIATAGRLVLPDDRLVDCTVHDISETGAMLFIETEEAAPPEFVLEIQGNMTVTRRCAKVWQEGTTIGVSFPDRQSKREGT
jgi:hypothetical protein